MAKIPPSAAAAIPTVASTIPKIRISISFAPLGISPLPRERVRVRAFYPFRFARLMMLFVFLVFVGGHSDGGEYEGQAGENQALDKAYQQFQPVDPHGGDKRH